MNEKKEKKEGGSPIRQPLVNGYFPNSERVSY